MKRYQKPHRIRKKKPFFKNRVFWLFSFILIFIFIIFYFIFLSPFFQVKRIEIYGLNEIPAEQIKSLVWEKLEKKLIFFTSKSIFFVKPREISVFFLEQFPKISEVRIQKKLPDLIIFRIKEREPVAVFVSDSERFLLDITGTIFEKAKGNENLLSIKTEPGLANLELGKKILTKEELSLVLDLQAKLKKEFGIEIIEVSIVFDERINLKTLEGWFIFMSPEETDWQLEKLKVLLEKEIPKEKIKSLEYIDLRFGNFAPYKYR